MKLSQLKTGAEAVVQSVGGAGLLRIGLLDMGITPGTTVRVMKRAPLGDPVEIRVRGYSLSLRLAEASVIEVEEVPAHEEAAPVEDDFGYSLSLHEENSHPGFGEGGKYHTREDELKELPKDTRFRYMLVGQNNSGKITLRNVLEKRIQGELIDLPHIYSLSEDVENQAEVRRRLIAQKPHCIINVVDASNIERNLYLTVQLIALGIPMVLALNMMDEVRGNGGAIRINELEHLLGIAVVPISAINAEGVDELVSHAEHVARYQETPECGNLPEPPRPGEDHADVADRRFSFIEKVCSHTVIKPAETKESRRSRRIDRILTGRWTALPLFLLVMSMVIWLSVDLIGAPLQEWLGRGIDWLGEITKRGMEDAGVNPVLCSLVHDCIFRGVGAVVSFVPVIIILFFFMSLLEDSGYMSRVAFVTDKLLRHLGLTGRSIVPLLIGLGCSVPAVMSARTLPSSRDRHMTIFLIPFMSCSAKIPIYAFLSAEFFPGHGGLVLICLYLLGVTVGILTALIRRLTRKSSSASPFVMEIPHYRIPAMRNVAKLLWERTKDFLQNAMTVIFLATIVIWLLQSFDFRFRLVGDSGSSMLAWLAGLIAPAFSPLGLGDWKVVTALISGFMAKEGIVASLEVLNGTTLFTTASAVSMLVFSLLYTPCVSTIAAVKRELGRSSAIFMIFFQCILAWVVALAAYRLALLIFI